MNNDSGRRSLPRWTSTFIPNKDVSVTPLIISANVVVWLAMIATGISPYMPTPEDVLRWGANSTQAVTDGEYWRLWTSNYLHYGFLHLGVNMLSLHNVGRMLERFIGKWRFAMLYTVTGIFASAVSIWWNAFGVGVGASGAILGIVGVLTALLTTNLIDKAVRMQMLRSIGFSILLMLLIGLNASIDNAAHIGGLLSGAIGGYFIYPELRTHYYEHKTQYRGLIAALILIAGGTGFFVMKADRGNIRSVEQIMNDFADREQHALQQFDNSAYQTPQKIEDSVVSVYERGLKQLDTIGEMPLNDLAEKQVAKTRIYMQARINYFRFVARAMREPHYQDSAAYWHTKTEEAFRNLNAR